MNMHQKALAKYGLYIEPTTPTPVVAKKRSGAEEMDDIFGAPTPTPAQQIESSREEVRVVVKQALKASKCNNRMCGSYNDRDIVGCSRIERPSNNNCSNFMGLQ